MSPIVRNLKSFSGALLSLIIMLIVIRWILNFVQGRNWPLLSSGAGTVSGLISGTSSGQVNNVPSMSPPVQSNGYSF